MCSRLGSYSCTCLYFYLHLNTTYLVAVPFGFEFHLFVTPQVAPRMCTWTWTSCMLTNNDLSSFSNYFFGFDFLVPWWRERSPVLVQIRFRVWFAGGYPFFSNIFSGNPSLFAHCLLRDETIQYRLIYCSCVFFANTKKKLALLPHFPPWYKFVKERVEF